MHSQKSQYRKKIILTELKRIKYDFLMKKYTDYEFITKTYRDKTGKDLNLKNPQKFTEKLQWLKLFYRNSSMPLCSDKYLVRDYISQKGYTELLNTLYGVYDYPEEICFELLPDQFVIKGTSGSGWNLICSDKKKVDWIWWKRIMSTWKKQNLYAYGREWNYEKLNCKFIVEKYLEDDTGELRDFKIFCFNGKPEFMQIDENRFTDHKRIYVKRTGEIIQVSDGTKELNNFTLSCVHQKLFSMAEALARDFPFVRVDFYVCNDKIYFGELTFFDGSGFYNLDPINVDYKWGSYLTLPEPNYNLELYANIMNSSR